jgi:cytochrome b561
MIGGQFLAHEGIEGAWDKVEKGLEVTYSPLVAGHVFGGLAILLLAVWRISIKIKRGSPALPESEPKIQKIAAHATHGILYLLMLLVPISGAVAWFGGVMPAADGHEVMTSILLFVVALHFVAALYHHFYLKTDILRRMLRRE